MDGFTDSMVRLTEAFAKMPGIGRKTAERLTYYVLRADEAEMDALARAVLDVKHTVDHCSTCHNITESDPCAICADPRRDHHLVCVVEEPKDLFAMESTGVFRGVYHVLMGHIAPLENVGPGDLTIRSLLDRCRENDIEEVILATNPTLEGDGTALYIRKQLEPLGVTVTRLGRGLSAGSAIEHANPAILTEAFSGRTTL
jgi:recombination protein RecR